MVTSSAKTNKEFSYALLKDPRRNRGPAFTARERAVYRIEGLLPPTPTTLALQVAQIHEELSHLEDDLHKYILLSDLQARNETLFYAVLMSDPATFMPLVYTPTVGEACQKFDHFLRPARGVYLPITAKGRLAGVAWPSGPRSDVRFIVVTDGERILGLGDLGVGGMGIPVGKLSLYTACAGVPPQLTLPITLDVGTNNHELLEDPLYLGLRQRARARCRLSMTSSTSSLTPCRSSIPQCCMQWEDFANFNAVPILEQYRDQDLHLQRRHPRHGRRRAGRHLRSAAHLQEKARRPAIALPRRRLGRHRHRRADQRGDGARGQRKLNEARARNWLFDVNGLMVKSRNDVADFQKPFAHRSRTDRARFRRGDRSPQAHRHHRCQHGAQAFQPAGDRSHGRDQRATDHLPVFQSRPLAPNARLRKPTAGQRARPSSPAAARFRRSTSVARPSFQARATTSISFPRWAWPFYATEAKRVTEAMFIVAAKAVAEQVGDDSLASGLIYPPQSRIRAASLHVAVKIAEYIFAQGLARVDRPDNIEEHIRALAYRAEYRD